MDEIINLRKGMPLYSLMMLVVGGRGKDDRYPVVTKIRALDNRIECFRK